MGEGLPWVLGDKILSIENMIVPIRKGNLILKVISWVSFRPKSISDH